MSADTSLTKKTIANNKKELAQAMKSLKEIAKERSKLGNIKDIRKRVDSVFSNLKEGEKKLQDHDFFKKKTIKSTPTKEKTGSSNGKFVNKGIDDSLRAPFAEDEQSYLDDKIDKIKEVKKLDYDCLRYLVTEVYLDDLKKIKEGKVKSKMHTDFHKKGTISRADLLSQIRTSLFTNDQIDYINGLLQGTFDTIELDDKGDIKHAEIDYVLIVMFSEVTIRIVKHVHKFKTVKQAQAFMVKSGEESD